MGRTPKSQCIDCGKPLQFVTSIRCRACYMKAHMAQDSRPRCIDCGKPISWNLRRTQTRCQSCGFAYRAEQRKLTGPKCSVCGGPVSTKKTSMCISCLAKQAAQRAEARTCPNCGVPISPNGTLCRSCYVERQRAEAASRTCTICGKKAKAKGLCATHYHAQYPDDANRRRGWGMKKRIQSTPCCLCGYCKFPVVQAHRPRPELGYVMGNMVPLCPTCHTEVTLGFTPSPPYPWYPDWYNPDTQSIRELKAQR